SVTISDLNSGDGPAGTTGDGSERQQGWEEHSSDAQPHADPTEGIASDIEKLLGAVPSTVLDAVAESVGDLAERRFEHVVPPVVVEVEVVGFFLPLFVGLPFGFVLFGLFLGFLATGFWLAETADPAAVLIAVHRLVPLPQVLTLAGAVVDDRLDDVDAAAVH